VTNDGQVPLPALERLSTYIRCLMQLEHEGVQSVSSQEMEAHTGVTAAQFRKDLSYFGEFGKRGIGYNVRDLRERIAQLLKVDEDQNVLLVGAGNLGQALIAYPGWRLYHFRICAVFDKDPTSKRPTAPSRRRSASWPSPPGKRRRRRTAWSPPG
jgi:redox-sensing transcriptional repressor